MLQLVSGYDHAEKIGLKSIERGRNVPHLDEPTFPFSNIRRRLSSNTERDPNVLISGGINSLVRKEKKVAPGKDAESDDDDDTDTAHRTATGGIINTLLVFLCFVAFLGNAIFLYHVFFGKEKVVPLKLVDNHDHRM